jgi:hypothetical protein
MREEADGDDARFKWATVIAVLATVILLADLYLFGEYVRILSWHAWHGNRVEMNGLRFRVPLLYAEDHGDRMNVLSIDRFPSRFSSKLALIRIEFYRQIPVIPDAPQAAAVLQQFGVKKSGRHKLRLADREGTCIDYIPVPTSAKDGAPAGLRVPAGFYSIHCTFGEDLGANFDGTEDAIADFYAIIQSAETVKGGH